MAVTRRDFLIQSTAALGTAALSQHALAVPLNEADPQIAIFEKAIQSFSYEELAAAVNTMGVDGIEATLRPGGHIEPVAIEDELPKMVAALAKHSKQVLIAASKVSEANAESERYLKALAANGVQRYRMGYYEFKHSQPMRPQVQKARSAALELAALNKEIGIQAIYQNHSGAKYLGALAWDLGEVLDGIDPAAIGVACDLRHLRADGGMSWKTAAEVFRPHLAAIYVKDATWPAPHAERPINVPVGKGFVSKEMFDYVRGDRTDLLLCVHQEYLDIDEHNSREDVVNAYRNDVDTLRAWLKKKS